jgi:hypothetical protein
MNESNVLNGIIDDNIHYFIENKAFRIYKLNFVQYLDGDLVDIETVYDTILKHVEHINIVSSICTNCLESDKITLFITQFVTYLVNKRDIGQLYSLINSDFIDYMSIVDFNPLFDCIITNKYIIDSYFVNNTLYKPTLSYQIVLKMLKKRELRTNILEYFSEKIEKCKSEKMIKSVLDLDKEYINSKNKSDEFNINLVVLLFQLWYAGINTTKMKDISEENTNFLSKSYFIIHQLLEHSYLQLYEEKQIRINELNKIKDLRPTLDRHNISKFNILTDLIRVRLKSIKTNTTQKNTLIFLQHFYELTTYWIIHRKIKDECDSILECIHLFYKHNKLELDNNMTLLMKHTFKGTSITNNPNIRINYLGMFHKYIMYVIKLNEKVVAISDYVNYDKNINTIVIEFSHLFNYIKNAFNNEELYNVLYPMSILSNILNLTIYKLDDYRISFDDNRDTKYFKALVYNNMNNFQYVVDEILHAMVKINKEENGNNDITVIEEEKLDINNLTLYLNIFSQFIVKTSKYYSDLVLCDELKNCVINIIVNCINNLATNTQSKYKIKNKENLDFTPISLLETLKTIIFHLITKKDNEELILKMLSLDQNYTHDSILRLITILSKRGKIKTIEFSHISYFNIKLNKKRDVVDDDIEIPEELCDPIMDTLIESPVMLPNNIIIDCEVIKRHLLTCETNPFNRDVLTLEILDDYNSKDDIKEKIDIFKEKIKAFKIEHNLI